MSGQPPAMRTRYLNLGNEWATAPVRTTVSKIQDVLKPR